MKQKFKEYLKQAKSIVDENIEKLLPVNKPNDLHDAMRYSILNSGKRIRPILLMAADTLINNRNENQFDVTADMFSENIIKLSVAIEAIHTYSLIHDDLPAMDNDDTRRGKPTLHIKYDEATAILAGDALLTYAFQLISGIENITAETLSKILYEISFAAGPQGMIAGQYIDIISEGQKIELATLEYIHKNKTMRLIRLPLILAALLNNADKKIFKMLSEYGEIIGLLFQISDDILNVTGSAEKMGKPVGTDIEKHKATYPAILGLDKSIKIAEEYGRDAIDIIKPLDNGKSILSYLPEYLIKREN